MVVFLNILPNIYWGYNHPAHPVTPAQFNIDIIKFTEQYNIKNTIKIDTNIESYWGKSRLYINDIRIQMEKEEFSKLLALLRKTQDMIKTSYLNNRPTLIYTQDPRFTEIGLAFWIYYFHINSSLNFDNCLKMMGQKVVGNITLGDQIRKFFLLLEANKA